MRKKYNRLVAEYVLLDVEPIMIIASAEQGNVGVGDKPVGGETPDLSNEFRCGWENIWEESL